MFKIGDKVRVVKNESGFMFDKYICKTGEIKDLFKIGIDNVFRIEFDDKSLTNTNWNDSELELVEYSDKEWVDCGFGGYYKRKRRK